MSNNSFDRCIINVRERPLSSDINLAESELDEAVRNLLDAQTLVPTRSGTIPSRALTPRAAGFFGDGFRVTPNPAGADTNIFLSAGVGMQDQFGTAPTNISGIVNLNDVSRLKPLILSPAAGEVTVGHAVPNTGLGAGNSRMDIIEVRANLLLTDTASRDILNAVTGIFAPNVVPKTLQWLLDNTITNVVTPDVTTTAAIKYKQGIVSATLDPLAVAVPPTTPGYIKIAEVFVSAANTTFGTGLIKDMRPYILQNGMMNIGCSFLLNTFSGGLGPVRSEPNFPNCLPAGVIVASTGNTGAFMSGTIYIIAGRTAMFASPALNISLPLSTFDGIYPAKIVTNIAGSTIVTATDQTQLNSVAFNTDPVLVAIGQPCIKIPYFFAAAATNAAQSFNTLGDIVSLSGNVLLQAIG